MKVGSLIYLYMGTKDTEASLRFYQDTFGGQLVWRFQKFGADVGAVRLPGVNQPLFILADHKPSGYLLPIFSCDHVEELRRLYPDATTAETPDGPCLIVEDPKGNRTGFLHEVRPHALENISSNSPK